MAANQLTNEHLKKLFDVYISNFSRGFWPARETYEAQANKKLNQLLAKKKWSCETFINVNSALILYYKIISAIRDKPKKMSNLFLQKTLVSLMFMKLQRNC